MGLEGGNLELKVVDLGVVGLDELIFVLLVTRLCFLELLMGCLCLGGEIGIFRSGVVEGALCVGEL